MQPTPTTISSSSCPPLFSRRNLHNLPLRNHFCFSSRTTPNHTPTRRSMASSLSGVAVGSTPPRAVGSSSAETGFSTLMDYVGKGGINAGDDLVVLLYHLQYACKRIAALVASPFNSSIIGQSSVPAAAGTGGSGRDAPKPLDIVSVSVLVDARNFRE